MKKRMMLILLAVVCVAALVFALPAGAEEISGTCGEGVNWVLKDGILTISGTGEITSNPWIVQKEEIREVIIEEGVTAICDEAFAGCSKLFYVTVAPGVAKVGSRAFDTGKTLAMYFKGDAPEFHRHWYRANDLVIGDIPVFIHYPMENTTWENVEEIKDAVLWPVNYGLSGTCGENLTYTIDGTVLTVSGNGPMAEYDKNLMPPWTAFCRVITKVVIEEGVTELSHKAFIDFEEMTTLEMADSVTQIGGQAFKNCYKLKSVKLSDNLKFIGDFAFGDCTALKEIHIPASVEEMDTFTFFGCTALEKVWFYGDAPFVDMPFEGLTLTAYYPAGNETWTEKARAEFGGNVTWLEHGGNEETEPTETQPEETEPEETKPEETEPVETEPEETEPEETKPEETEPVETEPEETEPEETKPKDTEPEETEPEDTEPEDTEPVVTDPQEPVQTQPAETKPEETEPEDDRPPHTEVKPGDNVQSDNPVRSSWWVIVGIVAVILVIGPVVALIVVKSKK